MFFRFYEEDSRLSDERKREKRPEESAKMTGIQFLISENLDWLSAPGENIHYVPPGIFSVYNTSVSLWTQQHCNDMASFRESNPNNKSGNIRTGLHTGKRTGAAAHALLYRPAVLPLN